MRCCHGIETPRYCLGCVYDKARQRCRDRSESWRWGEARRDPATGRDACTTG